MSHLSRYDNVRPLLRRTLITLLAVAATSGCDRFNERVLGRGRPSAVAQTPSPYDSMSVSRDSINRRNQALQDSLDAVRAVQRASDSVTHPGRKVAATPIILPPQVLSRAEILGDSIANAQIAKIAGQNRQAENGDTVRGVIKMDGSGPGSRPILMANGGKTEVTLSGMGTNGLSQVIGSDVVVRGMRVSPRDIVVSGFSVRAVNGIPTIDGRLLKLSGGWVVELSDKSGYHKLSAIPEALQAFEGARVWVAEEAKNSVPQLYGVIARR